MYKSNAAGFGELRQYLDNISIIDSHEHYVNYGEATDALSYILSNYYYSDYLVAGGDEIQPKGLSSLERYERFTRIYRKSRNTANARCMMEGLGQCWGITSIEGPENLKSLEDRLKTYDPSLYEQTLEKLKIKASVMNINSLQIFMSYVDGEKKDQSKSWRFVLPLPSYHNVHTKADLMLFRNYLGRSITCLDDYLESFDCFLKKCADFGIVCLKDQSAYRRSIAYGNPGRAEAEQVFNNIIFHPRDVFGDDTIRPLDDWLFQYAMRKAAEYSLPVQLHTGAMANIRNEITKTNAVHLIPTIELHQDVRFVLFHGSWPYMDEYLFLGKSYPNVFLDLCWVQNLDPIFSVELMKRIIMTVPHSKVFAFGGDTKMIEWTAGYLTLAKDNVAAALSELVDSEWLNMNEAKQIALDWFFNNPNEFYRLGLE